MTGRLSLATIGLMLLSMLGAAGCVESSTGAVGPNPSATPIVHPPVRQTAEALYTPPPTPMTAVGPDCPVDKDVCVAARNISDAVASHRLEAVPEFAGNGLEVRCPAVIIGAVLPACENAANETRTGFGMVSKSVRLVTRDELLAFMDTQLHPTIGGKEVDLAPTAVGCVRADEQAQLDCSTWAAAAFGPAEPEGVPVIVIFQRTTYGIGVVSGQYYPSGYPNRGGWVSTRHEGTSLPERLWFTPWQP